MLVLRKETELPSSITVIGLGRKPSPPGQRILYSAMETKKIKLSSFEDKISSNGILERNTGISNSTYSFAGISNSDPHLSETS